MKQRFKNSIDLKARKRGPPVITAVLILLLVSGALAACQAAAADLPSDSSAQPSSLLPAAGVPSGSASPCSSSSDGDEEKALELATAWAEGVKNRDGKAQYALYTTALQETLHDAYAGLNWVTGTSSPWVESYTVELTVSGATVTFKYATSTGPAGEYDACLEFE